MPSIIIIEIEIIYQLWSIKIFIIFILNLNNIPHNLVKALIDIYDNKKM